MKYLIISALAAHLYLFSTQDFEEEFFWPQIKEIQEQGNLPSLIEDRMKDIECLKDRWRPFISTEQNLYPEFFSLFRSTLNKGNLLLENSGAGAAYILYDDKENPQFVIKPTDEDIFCLNNPKHFASPFIDPDYRVKHHIPLYRSAQTEAVCYEMAQACHLDHVTPTAVLSLISHPNFFHIYKSSTKNHIDNEKLCSIQEYLKKTISLRDVLEELFTLEASEESLLEIFDQEDFEEVIFFLWLTFDNDAHTENFRVYPKKKTSEGKTIYGIQKIDNSLSLPECNSGFSNALMHFPHALLPISPKIKSYIESIPLEEIQQILMTFGLESSLFALRERVFVLQELIQKKEMTYYECSLRLSLLEKEEGILLALSDAPIEKLEYFGKDLLKIQSWFESEPEG